MIVFGIDPGTTTVGYAVIEKTNSIKLLDYGVIEITPKIELKYKLLEISKDLESLIQSYKPDRVVIEKLFFTNNLKTGIDVAHARGVIILEFTKRGIEILEYTPLELKSGICGNGKANKLQLQNAIKILLKLEQIPKPDDARDAIGLAYMGILKNF